MRGSSSRRLRVRAAAIVLHRWVGLALAVFLLLAGLTGSVLAFYRELDGVLNPELFEVTAATPGAAMLDPIELRDRFRSQLAKPDQVHDVLLDLEPGHSVNYWVDGHEVFVNPYTAEILGSRKFAALSEGKRGFLTFLYAFHFSLGLDDVGIWVLGAVALLWTVDCFVGAYLTFPPPHDRKRPGKSWFARWLPAWKLKTNNLFTSLFTWHRASGLWIWGLLLVFAWSGVALNLGEQVYRPVMDALGGANRAEKAERGPRSAPRANPKLDARAALAVGRKLMAEEAERRGFAIRSERSLRYDPEYGAYSYSIDSSLDVDERVADTTLAFDGDDGRLIDFHAPLLTTRSAFDTWLIALHFGRVGALGLPYRAFVSLVGVAVAALSVSGVWIWLRKRRKARRWPAAPGSHASNR